MYLSCSLVFCGFILSKNKYGEFEIHGLDVEITSDIGILYQEITLVKASLAWRADLCIYLKCCMRINILQNCFWDFLYKNSFFLQVVKPIHLNVKKYFVRKELKIRSNQYFLFYIVNFSTIQLKYLLYKLIFPRLYSGMGWSVHRVDHWIRNINKEETFVSSLNSSKIHEPPLLLLFWFLLRSSWISWESAKH